MGSTVKLENLIIMRPFGYILWKARKNPKFKQSNTPKLNCSISLSTYSQQY